jgi:hypothetical protein
MLDLNKVDEVLDKVAATDLKRIGVSRVYSKVTVDSEGHDALQITVVLRDDKKDGVSGDDAVDIIVGIERELRRAGEERLPIIEFATEEELQSSGDTEL